MPSPICVSAVIPVIPSETLAIYVGGQGTLGSAFNGGGAGGKTDTYYSSNGGGGASDVREGGDALMNRVVVAPQHVGAWAHTLHTS
jgi:hypothetical protein